MKSNQKGGNMETPTETEILVGRTAIKDLANPVGASSMGHPIASQIGECKHHCAGERAGTHQHRDTADGCRAVKNQRGNA